jgi:hypothetical protein
LSFVKFFLQKIYFLFKALSYNSTNKKRNKDFKMKKTLLSLAVASIFVGSLEARGHHSKGGFDRGDHREISTSTTTTFEAKRGLRGHGIFRYVSQITDLSDDQVTEIETIISDERTAMDTLREDRVSDFSLLDVVSEDGLDRETFLENEADFHLAMAEIKADSIEALLATLTSDQIVELQTLLSEDTEEVVTEDETTEDTESSTTAE